MAALNSIRVPVDSSYVLSRGGLLMGIEAKLDFALRGKVDDAQERDKETGMRVWLVIVTDLDQVYQPDVEQDGFRRTAELKVKVVSNYRPVPPPTKPGELGPVIEFEELTLTPYPDTNSCKGPRDGRPHRCGARLAYSMRATGIREFSGLASTRA